MTSNHAIDSGVPTTVHPAVSRSWFTQSGARSKAAALRADLERVVKPGNAVFLTLTYARGDESPADLWDRASRDRHVRRFIDHLERELGRSLRGQWVRKAEFQRGGFVHWHLIIRGLRFLPHAVVASAWRHGYVWVSACTRRRLSYFAKYFAKDGKIPAFLWAARSRSVKIVAASPGFWLSARGTYAPTERKPRSPVFRPICSVMERQGVVVRIGKVARGFSVPIAVLASATFSATRSVLSRIMRTDSWPEVERLVGAASARQRAPRLHLTNHPNPPTLVDRWLPYMVEIGAVAA